MRILISGAGIAGPTLAFWLAHYGFEPTIVEQEPRLRTGGYVIDFWGAGFDVAGRMGVLAEVRQKGFVVQQVKAVNRDGKTVASFPVDVFSRITHGRYISLPRGDLAAALFAAIEGRVETIFGDSVAQIEQTADSVRVTFERAAERQFDLVIGADGLHSRVRELVFGPAAQFEKYLGFQVAAFSVAGYRPRDELTYMMYTEVGRQVARFSMRDDRTMFLFTFIQQEGDVPDQKALLKSRFADCGWECPRILQALDACTDLYFDRVSQIVMDPAMGLWSRGRVSLIGDAASCVSLLAGQGSALAMVAAYILAGELHRARGNYTEAFARYQSLFGPFVRDKQKVALGLAGAFAPKSKAALFVRNQVMNLLRIPVVAGFVFNRGITDRIVLPDYSKVSKLVEIAGT